MKRQLQGIALILIGIQLTMLEWVDLSMIPVVGHGVKDVGNIVIVLPAFVVSAVGLLLCFKGRGGPK